MPAPKDPVKYEQWLVNVSRGLKRHYEENDHHCLGKKADPEVVAKRAASIKKVYEDPAKRKQASERAKSLGLGKWMKGRKLPHISEANKERLSGKTYKEIYGKRAKEEARKRRDGNRKRWEGTEREPQREKHGADWRYKAWRTKVFKRDDYTCQRCLVRGGELEAHHIKQWALYPSLRFITKNGITYCKACHKIIDSESGTRKRKRC